MLKKLRRFWRKVIRIFSRTEKSNPMAEYDGKRCRVYLIDGVRLVGTVRILEDRAWIQVEDHPRSCLVRTTQIASIKVA